MECPLLFDAVLFDLDGTLVATDRFWIQAARTGARRAFDTLGIERPLPTREEWLSVVGLELSAGFDHVLADLDPAHRRTVQAACEEEEGRLLAAGGAAWMPGAERVVRSLRARGARLGIASNCSLGYLEHMQRALGLHGPFDSAHCLDTPGVKRKADMIARLLDGFGTRSAVMVGDRRGDRDAAWENGIPHVHCAFGFAGDDEPVEAQATIEDMGELPGVLDRRARWIEAALRQAGGWPAAARGGRPMLLGVTGDPLSGRSLFARDAARLLAHAGFRSEVLALAEFRRPGTGADGPAGFDLDALEQALGAPWPADVLLLEGAFLLDPRIQSRLDRVLFLELPEQEAHRRWRALPEAPGGVDERGAGWQERIRAEAAHRDRYDPRSLADLLVEASNPLGPPLGGADPVERAGGPGGAAPLNPESSAP